MESPKTHARKRLDSIFNRENHIEQSWTEPARKSFRLIFVQTLVIALAAFSVGVLLSPKMGFAVMSENELVLDLRLKLRASKLLVSKHLERTRRFVQNAGLKPANCITNAETKPIDQIIREGNPKNVDTSSKVQTTPMKPIPNPDFVEYEMTKPKFMEYLPDSDVWCNGKSKHDRICRFKNLCYSAKRDQWFILKSSKSIIEGVPSKPFGRQSPLLELSSIDNHSFFYWYSQLIKEPYGSISISPGIPKRNS